MEQVIDLVVKALGGILVTVLVGLAGRALQRMGIALDADRQAQLESVARAAVLKVEEMAAAQARQRVTTWTGPEKLQAAVTEVVDRIPRVDKTEAQHIVQAVLPTLGLGATELGKALRTQ